MVVYRAPQLVSLRSSFWGLLKQPYCRTKKKKAALVVGLSPEKNNYPQCLQANTETPSPLTETVPSTIFMELPFNYNFAVDNETDI